MNLKTVIYRRVAERFRVTRLQDFRAIRAAEILSVEGAGKAFLNRLRLHLAHHSINLLGDNAPAYWLRNLTPQGDADDVQTRGLCPFTIAIDVNETLPFRFDTITDRDGNVIDVPTERIALYTQGLGDYSIREMEHLIQIERKGDDLPSSLAQRRAEFEAEICRLSESCEFAAVIVEHPWRDIGEDSHEHGARAKAIFRTVLQWQISYPGVHWWFCESRPMAESVCYRLLEAFWWRKQRELSEAMDHNNRPEIIDTESIWTPVF